MKVQNHIPSMAEMQRFWSHINWDLLLKIIELKNQ